MSAALPLLAPTSMRAAEFGPAAGPGAGITASSGVLGRRVFYNQSAFDGRNAAANPSDDAAIAPDKAALLPGQKATFANYTSYARGLNGVMIDIGGLTATPMAENFAFKIGNDNSPSAWADAPAPAIARRIGAGAGAGGSDRITLTWPSGAIKKQWLQVTVKPTPVTGLSSPDVFYFGNAVGESGNSTTDARVTSADETGARSHPRGLSNPAPITLRWDYNRDKRVNATDQMLARANATPSATALKRISAPGQTGPAGWSTLNGLGYGGGARVAPAGAGTKLATWTFTDLPDGSYTLQATWLADPANAADAPFEITNGAGLRVNAAVDQRRSPSGSIFDGKPFQSLGTVDVSGSSLLVTLSDRAAGRVVADAVRLVPGPVDITNDPEFEIKPDLVADRAGNLHAAYLAGPLHAWHVFYRFKSAGGAWTTPLKIEGPALYDINPTLAVSSDNVVSIAWSDYKNLMLIRGEAGGTRWTSTRVVAPEVGVGRDIALAADPITSALHVLFAASKAGITRDESLDVLYYCE